MADVQMPCGAYFRSLRRTPSAEQEGAPRHLPWEPVARFRDQHKAATTSEPLGLRRLRRLQRRLQHLRRFSEDFQLASKIVRDLQSLVTEFPDVANINLVDLHSDVEAINAIVSAAANTARTIALDQWRDKMRDDPIAQAAWIKNKAAMDMERAQRVPTTMDEAIQASIHPARILEEQRAKWTRVWNPPPELQGSVNQVRELLCDVPQPVPLNMHITWDVAALQRATRAMIGKVGGADDWRPEDLLLLPQCWWQCFATLWKFIYREARLPFIWKLSRVTLARKPNGTYRPISLCSVAWRAGSRHLCRSLRPWARSWMGARDLGGLPGASPADAHGRLFAALLNGADCFLQEDLTTFFDTVSIDHAVEVLRHLQAPSEVMALLTDFYTHSARILSFAQRGLMQGCPLSALVAACVMHVWTTTTADANTECLAFLDDRTVWLAPSGQLESTVALHNAAARGRRFDTAFDLTCDKRKSAVVGCPAFQALADELEYPRATELEALGLVHPLDPLLPRRLRKLSLQKVEFRFKFISAVSSWRLHLLRHVRCLVLSMIQWAAGYASPGLDEFVGIREGIFRVFRRNVVFETPKILFYEVMDWWPHPGFVLDWAVLLAIERFQCRRPAWLEHVALFEAGLPWRRFCSRS